MVQAWLDPAAQSSARLDDDQPAFVDLEWLAGGANTLYLVAPLDDQRRLAPVLGGLLGDLKDQAYQWQRLSRIKPSGRLALPPPKDLQSTSGWLGSDRRRSERSDPWWQPSAGGTDKRRCRSLVS